MDEIFYDPRHPYTWGLLRSIPAFSRGKESLPSIPGMPPSLLHPPKGDAFASRNAYALEIDFEEEPPMFRVTDSHYAATWLLDERAPKVVPPIEETQMEHEILLDVRHLTHIFPLSRKTAVKAVDDVSFQIRRGEILDW